MYIPLGPSKKDLYKIIIGLLLIVYLIFLGMYKPKAEVLSTGLYGVNLTRLQNNYSSWGTSCTSLTDSPGIGICNVEAVFDHYDDLFGRFYITNGGVLSNKTVSFTFYKSLTSTDLDLTGLYFIDNNISYSCEIYNTISSHNGNFYNVVCPNLPTLTGNGTSVGFKIRDIEYNWSTTPRKTIYPTFGLSAINGWENGTTTINDIKNQTTNINNSINDSSIDNSSANDFTSNSAFQDSNGLDAIIKAPLNFIQSLTSTTCSTINLTIPYINSNVYLPCMSSVYNKALGQQLVNLIALVINGVVLYRYCLKILQIVKDAKNPNKDGLEVLDL